MVAYLWAQSGAPAGGAPTEDLIPAGVVGGLAILGLLVLAEIYRRGGARPLRRLADWAGSISSLPGWAALPAGVAAGSLIGAVFGFYWDVSTHIDNGRDPGPFANPSHYFILFGLAGIALAGYLSLLLASDSKRERTFIGPAPLGGALLALCGVIALSGFPLDDVWHRLFGQDVTLWGPTHIQMVGGAALTTLATWVLVREGQRAQGATDALTKPQRVQEFMLAGAFMVGLSALQAEFDFGAPQFQLLYQPVLLMVAAGIGLVAARVRLGRGGALGAVLFFLALRGLLALIVGPVLGRTTPHFPLYLVEALVVEAVALWISPRRTFAFAAAAGVGIGTLGLAAEWTWSHIWLPIAWPSDLLPEGLLLGFLAAFAAAIVGGFIGGTLNSDGSRVSVIRPAPALAALVVVILCIAFPAPTSPPSNVGAEVDLAYVERDGVRMANVTVRPEPDSITESPMWFELLSWQGRDWNRGSKIVAALEETEPSTFKSSQPVPIEGDWKTFLRLHNEGYLVALPIYMPKDSAIPAPEIPATASFQRDFVPDKEILQREATTDGGALQRVAYGILGAIALAWIAAFAWSLSRFGARPQKRTGQRVRSTVAEASG
ncbi:MAG TPA: hypothetical protein VNP73_01195 [Actinomycetota bacterium]|nr:hypothetical protein [Actinomycetota bacterium]